MFNCSGERNAHLIASVLVSLLSSSLAATCESVRGNLVATHNCGFAKDVDGWVAQPEATVSHDLGEGGVLRATSDLSGSLTVTGPCVTAQGESSYRIGARLRLAKGPAYFCSVNAFQYSDVHCSDNAEPLGSAAGPPGAAWRSVDGSATTTSLTKSVQLRAVCSGPPGFIVMFDDFVLVKN
jgi:hypothetical protein